MKKVSRKKLKIKKDYVTGCYKKHDRSKILEIAKVL